MVKFDIPDIRNDLPMSLTMAAFSGIAWYTSVDLNVRLFYVFRRRKGLYFWSCALCSWGIILHAMAIIIADFQVITDTRVSVPFIYLSWWFMTIPQSLVMYSRLHLIMFNTKYRRWILYMIIFTTVAISLPSMVMGPMAQQPTNAGKKVTHIYSVWVKIENTTWVVQETIISVLYIVYTHKHLQDISFFAESSSLSSSSTAHTMHKQVMHHLILTNLLIIVLDAALLAIQLAGLFYLGGAFKPAVYGLKLRIEFSILSRLLELVEVRRRRSASSAALASWMANPLCSERKERRSGDRPADPEISDALNITPSEPDEFPSAFVHQSRVRCG